MRVLQVHNRYRIRGGEDVLFDAIIELLQQNGIHVSTLSESSGQITQSLRQKISAFASGVYSPKSARKIAELIKSDRPDIVHVHNVFPMLSPSVILAAKRLGVPVVMSCHNYRLVCPIGIFYRNGQNCEACAGGREYQCVLKNCRENLFESAAYALRSATARSMKFYSENVDVFIAVSHWVKDKLVEAGFPAERISVLPNMTSYPICAEINGLGDYVGYVGRISEEKGIRVLVEANKKAKLPMHFAGPVDSQKRMNLQISKNETFVGMLSSKDLLAFIDKARFVVVPSLSQEPFGLAAIEAMIRGKPVIASNLGALAEIVDDGVNGYLFKAGDRQTLAEKMRILWMDRKQCQKMGEAGSRRAKQMYTRKVYFNRLLRIYQAAIGQ